MRSVDQKMSQLSPYFWMGEAFSVAARSERGHHERRVLETDPTTDAKRRPRLGRAVGRLIEFTGLRGTLLARFYAQ